MKATYHYIFSYSGGPDAEDMTSSCTIDLTQTPPVVTCIDDPYEYGEVRSLEEEYVVLPDGTEIRSYAVNANDDVFDVIDGSTDYDNAESDFT
jgi:hypothetical protein